MARDGEGDETERRVILVDTAALAVAMGVTARTIERRVQAGTLTPRGQYGKGSRRGRPGWFFDLEECVALDDDPPVSHIGS